MDELVTFGVVIHGYGGLGFAGMKVVDGMHAGQIQGAGRILRDARALFECEVIH